MESPEINPYSYGYLIFDKRGKNYTMGQRLPLQEMVLGNLDSCMAVNEVRTHPQAIHKANAERLKDLHIDTTPQNS